MIVKFIYFESIEQNKKLIVIKSLSDYINTCYYLVYLYNYLLAN